METNVVEQTIERERRYGGTEKKSPRLEGLRRSLCVMMRGLRRVRGEELYGCIDSSYSQYSHRIGKLYYYDDYGVSARKGSLGAYFDRWWVDDRPYYYKYAINRLALSETASGRLSCSR